MRVVSILIAPNSERLWRSRKVRTEASSPDSCRLESILQIAGPYLGWTWDSE